MAGVISSTIEVCVFKSIAGAPRYLLLRRSKKVHVYPGLWQFVTGTLEAKERAAEAALRELAEETGLAPVSFWVVPHVITFFDPVQDAVCLSPLFAAQVDPAVEPKLSEEHSEYGWFDPEEAGRMLVWPGQRAGLKIVNEFIVNGGSGADLTRLG